MPVPIFTLLERLSILSPLVQPDYEEIPRTNPTDSRAFQTFT